MKTITQFLAFSAIIILASCSGAKKGEKGGAEGKAELKTEKDRVSYAVGVNEADRIMNQLKQGGGDTIFNKDLVIKGMNDHFNNKSQMTPEQGLTELQKYFAKFKDAQVKSFKARHAKDKEAAEKFMAENKNKPGITTTLSGLQYEVIKKGNGPLIKLGDEIEVNYDGKLLDGSKVDASADHGAPFKFKLEPMGLIQGWVEGLQLMNKGAKYRFYIPYDLGYGEMGKDPKVPPYSVMVFELEVVSHTPQ